MQNTTITTNAGAWDVLSTEYNDWYQCEYMGRARYIAYIILAAMMHGHTQMYDFIHLYGIRWTTGTQRRLRSTFLSDYPAQEGCRTNVARWAR